VYFNSPFKWTAGKALVHFFAQPEPFWPLLIQNLPHRKCSRQPEKWTSVSPRLVHNEQTVKGGWRWALTRDPEHTAGRDTWCNNYVVQDVIDHDKMYMAGTETVTWTNPPLFLCFLSDQT
jgi:hypothetical protein